MPGIRKEKLRWDSVTRKIYALAGAKRTHRIQRKRRMLQAKSVEMDLQSRIEQSSRSLKALMEERDIPALNEMFGRYFQIQLSTEFVGREDFGGIHDFYHPILIQLSEEAFYAAMFTLLYTERVGKAYRMLVVKENAGTLGNDAARLKKDIELFRKAVSEYEFRHFQEAEDMIDQLLERYPEVPGFMKFKSRFLMERARNGIGMVEAELYIDEALRLFPEDGYFLKYRGELLWLRGKCADALEVFADARVKTNNGITQLELDKFLTPYSKETVRTCQMLLNSGQKEGAMQLIELWSRLLPESDMIQEYYYLARVCVARTWQEMEKVLDEIAKNMEKIEKNGDHPEKKEIYRRAMTRAWERLGYAGELAKIRTDTFYIKESDDLEWLAEKAKDCQIRRDKRAQVYKVVGDIRRKQGQTRLAFESYREAVRSHGTGYVKTELSRIIFSDLYEGAQKAASYAKATDASEYLDLWLGKYGSIEELQELVKGCL